MIWNLALTALASIFIVAAVLSMIGSKQGHTANPLEGYLLAHATLHRPSVVSLLLSSSFGINGLFYQVWLGFTVGAWGLLAQGAWALSFVFLAPHSTKIRQHRSLHDFLGVRFGWPTRVVAGFCSLIGMMYLMGWEVGVGKATLDGLLKWDEGLSTQASQTAASWLTGGTVFGCLLYTVLGGLRGNAKADIFMNLLKLAVVSILTVFLLQRFNTLATVSFWSSLFPSIDTMEKNLGWWGLITNIAFSLAWQFVDTSTWQSVIAGSEISEKDTAWNLRWGGLAVFIAPGIIGTLLGVSLVGSPDINPSNILSAAISLAPSFDGLTLFFAFALIITCLMSLIDGLFLASAFTLIVDILHPRVRLSTLDSDPEKADRLLLWVRFSLVAIAIVAVWGVQLLLKLLNLDLFQFVYIVVITQLALTGPVIIALVTQRMNVLPAWLAIVCALIVGFSSVAIGTIFEIQTIIDGAGTFTIISSILGSIFITKSVSQTQAVEV